MLQNSEYWSYIFAFQYQNILGTLQARKHLCMDSYTKYGKYSYKRGLDDVLPKFLKSTLDLYE